jgi:hypothetical protein
MQLSPKRIISAEQATVLLRAGTPLENCCVIGVIEITGEDDWDKSILISHCFLEGLVSSVTHFPEIVVFSNTCFQKCEFVFSYFLRGLTIENCTFKSSLDLQGGGRNEAGYPIKIWNSTFLGFVNFFDCWYTGEVSISRNAFAKGTNIASQKQLITFDFPPELFDNTGRLDIEAEFAD